MIDRRQVLAALAALAACPAAAAAATVDPEGARRIGDAYLAAHPAARDAARLRAALMPGDWSAAALARLRSRVAADFRAGRVFAYRGWRLSDTEGRLFALVALTPNG
ncbi:hypothetical protein [Phenylobacterium sp.]|jgi:hypothetical protein|uniref:hypothetical protein n=1 Tax=Phenylobacterium sp. TaxID=1871053 RepID=UPI002F95609B